MTDEQTPARPRKVQPDFSLDLGSESHSWLRAWTRFVDEHPEWWRKHQTEGPLYALLPDVIEALAAPRTRSHSKVKPILSQDAVVAERAFYKLCSDFDPKVIGVQEGSPIL